LTAHPRPDIVWGDALATAPRTRASTATDLEPEPPMHPSLRLVTPIVLAVSAPAQDDKPAGVPPIALRPVPTASPVYDFEVQRMDGSKTKLDAWRGKVLLLVNTASKCGLTPQYEGLQKLQETYGEKGFTVLAFPANDFGQQEPGSNQEIAAFCKDRFKITFPVFAKIAVKGEEQAPLYAWLTTKSPFPGEVQWNFQKYLVDRNGQVVARFDPRVKPGDAKVAAAIEAALAQPAAAQSAAAKPTKTAKPVGTEGSPTAATDAVAAACARAKAEDKVVFVHFRADWCGWCKKLEAFLARPEIAPIVEANFVDVAIDTDRMAGGGALCTEYAQGKSTGIPFMAWLDGEGAIVARSFDAQGDNIGYPSKASEIEAFMAIFGQQAKHASAEQVALVRKTLTDLGEKPKVDR